MRKSLNSALGANADNILAELNKMLEQDLSSREVSMAEGEYLGGFEDTKITQQSRADNEVVKEVRDVVTKARVEKAEAEADRLRADNAALKAELEKEKKARARAEEKLQAARVAAAGSVRAVAEAARAVATEAEEGCPSIHAIRARGEDINQAAQQTPRSAASRFAGGNSDPQTQGSAVSRFAGMNSDLQTPGSAEGLRTYIG